MRVNSHMEYLSALFWIQYQQILKLSQGRALMSTNSYRNSEPSPQQSRVSSSSSSQSQSYELIPRDDPYFHLNRDLPSPRSSFPFKKVQSGSQSNNLSKQPIEPKRPTTYPNPVAEHDSKKLIEFIGQLNQTKGIPKKNTKEWDEMGAAISHQECEIKIKDREKRIEELLIQIEQERGQYQLERKANQIYSQGFERVRELVVAKCGQLESEGVEELVEKLTELLKAGGSQYVIIEEQDQKIRQLRAELLKSSQNNINAIFNTEITQSHCLQLQIKRMNSEILNLKQNLVKASTENQQYLSKMLHQLHQKNINTSESKKIVKIYQSHKNMLDSESDDDIKKELERSRKHHRRNSSSSNESNKRSKRLKSTESKIGQLIEGYKLLRDQYRSVQKAIKQLNGSQTDFKQLFSILKKEITSSIQNQIKQVKQNVKRPSSNHQQLKIAKDLQSKLNHLVNTLNAPEKVNVQRSNEEDNANDWKHVQNVRKITQLQSLNVKLEKQIRNLQQEKHNLEETISHLSKLYANNNKLKQINNGNELYIQSVQDRRKKSTKKGEQYDEFLNSRSDIKEQQVMQHMSGADNNGPIIHTASFNKIHGSQSYHQSNTKNSEIEALMIRMQRYQQMIREKQFRITQLQNTILDHIESRAYTEPNSPANANEMKERYEIYIHNLKMLLSQSKKQNEFLKKEFIKSTQLNLSRANDLADHNSISLSERTTKNGIAQTRLIQRRAPKSNSYQSLKAKLELEQSLERTFFALLDLGQKIMIYQEVQRLSLCETVISCLKEVILESRERNSRLFQETMQQDDVKKKLQSLGLQLN